MSDETELQVGSLKDAEDCMMDPMACALHEVMKIMLGTEKADDIARVAYVVQYDDIDDASVARATQLLGKENRG